MALDFTFMGSLSWWVVGMYPVSICWSYCRVPNGPCVYMIQLGIWTTGHLRGGTNPYFAALMMLNWLSAKSSLSFNPFWLWPRTSDPINFFCPSAQNWSWWLLGSWTDGGHPLDHQFALIASKANLSNILGDDIYEKTCIDLIPSPSIVCLSVPRYIRGKLGCHFCPEFDTRRC